MLMKYHNYKAIEMNVDFYYFDSVVLKEAISSTKNMVKNRVLAIKWMSENTDILLERQVALIWTCSAAVVSK